MPQLCALLPSFQLAACYVVGNVQTSLHPWRLNVKSVHPNHSGDDRQDMQSRPNTLDHEALFRDCGAEEVQLNSYLSSGVKSVRGEKH